jgi:hypothetical protein
LLRDLFVRFFSLKTNYYYDIFNGYILIHTLSDFSDGAERFQEKKMKVVVKPTWKKEKLCLK